MHTNRESTVTGELRRWAQKRCQQMTGAPTAYSEHHVFSSRSSCPEDFHGLPQPLHKNIKIMY